MNQLETLWLQTAFKKNQIIFFILLEYRNNSYKGYYIIFGDKIKKQNKTIKQAVKNIAVKKRNVLIFVEYFVGNEHISWLGLTTEQRWTFS